MQQGMLFDSLQSVERDVYCMVVAYALAGPLDREAFVRGWQHVVDRHPVLRTSFAWDAIGEPTQSVHPAVTLCIEEQNWGHLSAAARDRAVTELLHRESQRGFDLREAPLMRLTLARCSDTEHRLVAAQHHILMDGSCKALLFHEAFSAYQAFRTGRTPELPEPIPYRHYIAWLREQDLSAAEEFWRAELRGFARPTPMTSEPPAHDPAGTTYREYEARLEPDATEALKLAARRARLTLNSVTCGAWALVLARANRRTDVVFGMTVNAKPPAMHEESIIGLFINTLPLRVRLDTALPASRWFRQIQGAIAGLREYDFAPLWRVQRWSDVPAGHPLFETIVVFENNPGYGDDGEHYGDIAVTTVRPFTRNSLPLTVRIVPGASIAVQLLYDAARFSDEATRQAGDQITMLLSEIARDPDQTVAALLGRLERLEHDQRAKQAALYHAAMGSKLRQIARMPRNRHS
jgi:hypothetical protein